ncbi:MAG TPA: hypothetical protein PJ988_13865 [Anaerolinea sp.]|nr:hypothetical protein [Anaerolinea sp.]
MKIARWIFLAAGVLGLVPLAPIFYELARGGQDMLPDGGSMGLFIYIFLALYTFWQIFYLILAANPMRFRPMIILAFFVCAVTPFNTLWLYFYGMVVWQGIIIVSLAFALLFLVAFWLTGRESRRAAA